MSRPRDMTTPQKQPGRKMPAVFFALALMVCGFAVYGNSLTGAFLWDDDMLVKDNPLIRQGPLAQKIWTRNILEGAGEKSSFYRPLQMATYALDYFFWRSRVTGYHLTNIFLHVLAAWFLFRWLALLFGDEALAFLAGVLFVVHPLHVEAVSYISGRSDTLSACFLLATLILYVKQSRAPDAGRAAWMSVVYAAALLSREQALILPAMLLAYHGIFKKKFVGNNFFLLAGVALAYLGWRTFVLRGVVVDPVETSVWERLPGFFAAFAAYLKLFVVPAPLHMEYGERLFSWTAPQVMAGLFLMVTALAVMSRVRDRRRIALFSLSWVLLTLLPVSHIYPVGAFMAEHWMYMPSMGLFLLLAWGLRGLYSRARTRALSCVLAVGLAVFYGFLTVRQNAVWRDPAYFYETTLAFAPDSARVLNNLGNARQDAGRSQEAVALYEKAVALKPGYAEAWNNLGIAHAGLGSAQKAVDCYKNALRHKPSYADAHYNLANVYQAMGRSDEAIRLYESAVRLRPDNADYHYNLGNAYARRGRAMDAAASYQKAMALAPATPDVANNLGLAYIAAGRKQDARALFEGLIRSTPAYAKAYTNMAVLCYEAGDMERARDYGRRAKELGDSLDPGFQRILFESQDVL